MVAEAIQESNSGDIQGLRQTLTFGGITWGAILLLWGVIALALVPSARRKRLLAKHFPNSIVVNGRWNADLIEVLSRHLEPGWRSSQLGGTPFTLVAGESGISFWTGFAKPKRAVELGWGEVQAVKAGSMSISAIRIVATVILTLRNSDESLQFALGSEGWLGAFPQNASSIDLRVGDLEVILNRAVLNH